VLLCSKEEEEELLPSVRHLVRRVLACNRQLATKIEAAARQLGPRCCAQPLWVRVQGEKERGRERERGREKAHMSESESASEGEGESASEKESVCGGGGVGKRLQMC